MHPFDKSPFGDQLPASLQRAVDDARSLERAMGAPDLTKLHDQIRASIEPVKAFGDEIVRARERLVGPLGALAEEALRTHQRLAERLWPLQGIRGDLVRQYQRAVEELGPVENALATARALQAAAGLQAFVAAQGAESFAALQRNWYESAAGRAFEGIRNFLRPDVDVDWEALWDQEAKSLSFAASDGWFIQPESNLDLTIEIDECGSDLDALERVFVAAMEPMLEQIRHRVCTAYPSRQSIISEAFALYEEARYMAAIPLFLMTADGIAHETSGKSAFRSSGTQTALADWVKKQSVDFGLRPYVNQLATAHSLSRSRHGRMSRHDVLHGIRLDYGTKENCLRAMSFLGFIAWLMAEEPEREAS